jgi:hypothetical protein
MRALTILFAAALAALPAAVSAQTADAPATFNAPSGWTAGDGKSATPTYTMLGIYYAPAPAAKGDNLNYGYEPAAATATLEDVVAQTRTTLRKMALADTVTDHAEQVCGGTQSGWFFQGNFTASNIPFTVQEVIFVANGRIYEAAYTRRVSEAEDPAARSALDTLCLAK